MQALRFKGSGTAGAGCVVLGVTFREEKEFQFGRCRLFLLRDEGFPSRRRRCRCRCGLVGGAALASPFGPGQGLVSSIGDRFAHDDVKSVTEDNSSSFRLDHNCKGEAFGYCTQNATFNPSLTLPLLPIGLIGGSNGNNGNNGNNANNGNGAG